MDEMSNCASLADGDFLACLADDDDASVGAAPNSPAASIDELAPELLLPVLGVDADLDALVGGISDDSVGLVELDDNALFNLAFDKLA